MIPRILTTKNTKATKKDEEAHEYYFVLLVSSVVKRFLGFPESPRCP
jgi:hypothetical protein